MRRTTQIRRSRRVRMSAAALLALVTLLAYAPAFDASFVNFDDDTGVVANAAHLGFSPGQLGWMATTFHQGHWQPLAWISLAVDRLLWGDDARGYHATNVLLHVLAVLLFHGLARRLLRAGLDAAPVATGAEHAPLLELGAFATALLFAVHPLRVEAVAWITERRLLLATCFLLLALRAYVPRRDAAPGSAAGCVPGEPASSRALPAMGRVSIFVMLSLLCTTWAATLPAVLLVLDVYPLRRFAHARGDRRTRRALVLEKLVLAVPCGAALAVAGLAQHAFGATASLSRHGVLERVLQAGYGLVFQPWKSLVPTSLGPLYPLRGLDASDWRWWIAPLVALALSLGAFAARRRAPAILAAWSAYAILAAPVLGALQSGPQLTADRYAYLPGLALSLLGGAATLAVARRSMHRRGPRATSRRMIVLLAAYALVAGTLTFAQTLHWRSSQALWTHALEVAPGNYIVHANLARAMRDAGDLQGALSQFMAARRDPPPDRAGRNDLDLDTAATLAGLGRLSEADTIWREILARDEHHVASLLSLGLAASMAGRDDDAVGWWRQALAAWTAEGCPEADAALAAQARAWIAETRPQDASPADHEALQDVH